MTSDNLLRAINSGMQGERLGMGKITHGSVIFRLVL
jgi:hypothetical protein